MVVVENIRSILCTRSLAAKTVDTSSPPIDILLQLLKRSKINREPKIVSSDFGVGGTFLGNCNGGVYVIPREKLRKLAPIWLKWAYWMLDQKKILGNYIKHTDQISFCFALLELNMDIELLNLEMNFPTHLKSTTYCDLHGISPKILHYHANASSFGLLQPIGRETVDSAIAKANASIKSFQSRLPPRFFVNGRLCFETLL